MGQHASQAELNLTVTAGSVTCLLGPNGIGKTTLFKTLLGLIPPLSGTIKVGSNDLASINREGIARQIAYVPQAQVSEFSYTVLRSRDDGTNHLPWPVWCASSGR